MIAPNDKQPGRNDPCPCGSGAKYKNCCLADDSKRRMQAEIKHLRILAHLLLSHIQQTTRVRALSVAPDVLANYPPEAAFSVARDNTTGDFLFWAEPLPGKTVIQPTRRIIVPQG